MGNQEPSHFAMLSEFHEKLDDFAADLCAAFESFMRSTGGGHVSAEFHVRER